MKTNDPTTQPFALDPPLVLNTGHSVSAMITAFFKPKSAKKVTPAPSSVASSTEESSAITKRAPPIEVEEVCSNKRLKIDKDDDDAVRELLSHLKGFNKAGDDDATPTWNDVLEKHFATPSFARLAKFVSAQRKAHKVYPPPEDTFAALNWTPLDQVKVVIVGQDPYHGPDQAHGLCFSVRKGIRTPPSLRNIYKELMNDAEISNFKQIPTHGNLERWAKQGVLMINTVLTVRNGEANSHQKKGWELVTDEIIRAVDRRAKEQRRLGQPGGGVVFLLWGKPATEKCQTALGLSNLESLSSSSSPGNSHRTIICSSHPSPLGATKTKSPFMGSKCFSRANQALEEFGYDKGIDWRVDGDL